MRALTILSLAISELDDNNSEEELDATENRASCKEMATM